MSQRASDGESIRQGPGKRSCKRSIDQTSGSSSSNQNSGALSDWLPGATVQTYCCSFLPFPAWKQSRDWWASGSRVPGGSCVCCLMLGTRVAKAVYYSKCGLARETLGSRTAWHHCYLLGSRAVASAPFSSSISRAVVVVLLKSSLVCSCASWLEWSYAGWGVLRLCPYFRAISTHLFLNGDTSRDIKTNIHRLIHTDILKTPVLAKVHWLFICISYVRFFPWPGIRKESGALFTHRKAQKRLRNWLCIEAVCSSFFYLKLSFTEITGLCGHGGRDVSPEGALGLLLGLYTIQEKLLGALMKFWMTK